MSHTHTHPHTWVCVRECVYKQVCIINITDTNTHTHSLYNPSSHLSLSVCLSLSLSLYIYISYAPPPSSHTHMHKHTHKLYVFALKMTSKKHFQLIFEQYAYDILLKILILSLYCNTYLVSVLLWRRIAKSRWDHWRTVGPWRGNKTRPTRHIEHCS